MDLLKQLRAKRDELLSNIEALMQGEDFDPNDATLVEARSEVEKIDSRIKALVDFSQSRNAANKASATIGSSGECRRRFAACIGSQPLAISPVPIAALNAGTACLVGRARRKRG